VLLRKKNKKRDCGQSDGSREAGVRREALVSRSDEQKQGYNRDNLEITDAGHRKEILQMNDMEEKPSLIVECPHCHKKVIPKGNNNCPSCREDMSDQEGVDLNQTSFTIHESEELPSFCYSCNMYTERQIRISGDKESDLEKMLFGPSSPEDTSNVIIYLPQCEVCSELNEPELVEVDYEHQTMTIVVHRGFRERVLQLHDAQSVLDDEKGGDNP
jgi:hypothetical protein